MPIFSTRSGDSNSPRQNSHNTIRRRAKRNGVPSPSSLMGKENSMKKEFLGTLTILAALAGLAQAQTPPPTSADAEPVRLVANPSTPGAKAATEFKELPLANGC